VAAIPMRLVVDSASARMGLLEMGILVALIVIWMEYLMRTWTVKRKNAKRTTVLRFLILNREIWTGMVLVTSRLVLKIILVLMILSAVIMMLMMTA
jgi:hypothetical protein